MSKRLLKGIAVTLGAGVAFGLGTKLSRGSASRRPNLLSLEPLIDRLDGIEDRVMKAEAKFSAAAYGAVADSLGGTPADRELLGQNMMQMDARLSAQNHQLDELRREIQTVGSRSASQVLSFTRKLTEVEAKLPADIESNVAERIAALEQRLQADFRQTHSRTVDLFVQTVESKVVQRITVLEQSLGEHANTIVGLREKSLSTDENLQRLLAAVEKLCAQTAAREEPPSNGASEKNFAAHLGREMSAPLPPETKSRWASLASMIAAFALSVIGVKLRG